MHIVLEVSRDTELLANLPDQHDAGAGIRHIQAGHGRFVDFRYTAGHPPRAKTEPRQRVQQASQIEFIGKIRQRLGDLARRAQYIHLFEQNRQVARKIGRL